MSCRSVSVLILGWFACSLFGMATLCGAPQSSQGGLATVDRIRFWSTDDYTRVVITLDKQVAFTQEALSRPPRIYFDLENSTLAKDLERQLQVDGQVFSRIRVGQNRPGVVRVVFDLASRKRLSVFSLQDPFRIVVDTRIESVARAQPDVTPSSAPEVLQKVRARLEKIADENHSASNGDAPTLTRALGLKVARVAIDPGHGGRDAGTLGPEGLTEKDVVLDISLKLRRLLTARLGVQVVLTREDDRYIPLERRTAIANQHSADLFVSIHANGSRHETVNGIETFYLSVAAGAEELQVARRENADSDRSVSELEDLLRKIAVGEHTNESQVLAALVQKRLFEGAREHHPMVQNRGIRRAPFIVLINAQMPSILTEIGFLSNRSDSALLVTEEGRERIAESLFSGIREYFETLNGRGADSRAATAQ